MPTARVFCVADVVSDATGNGDGGLVWPELQAPSAISAVAAAHRVERDITAIGEFP